MEGSASGGATPSGAVSATTSAPATGGAPSADPKAPSGKLDFERGDDAPDTEPKAPPKKYKVKDGDEELEVDESELLKGYQRARSATKRFEEAAQARKQVESILHALKSNPVAILQKLGIDPRQMSESYLKNVLEDEMLQQQDPRAYEVRKRERELEEREGKIKEFEEQRKQQAFEQQKAQAAQRYEKKFIQALQTAGVPKSPFTIKRMAEYERHAQKSGYDLSAEELGDLVKQDVLKEVKEMLGAGDPLALLGDDIAAKVREADLARVQQQRVPPHQQNNAQPRRTQEQPKVSMREMQEEIRKKYGVT